MEDNDDYEPDASGLLDLRYRGWTELELRVWSLATRLIHLDISFNQLQTLPDEISYLRLLQELNCSRNKLHSLPKSIGSLTQLRVLKANGNCIITLPNEIGRCSSLECLNLSENALKSIPQEIAECSCLRALLLQNNDLHHLPLSMAALRDRIEQMDVSNNNIQMTTTLPAKIHRDAHSIMWILALQQEKQHSIERLKQDMMVLQHDNLATERKLDVAKERIAELEEKKTTLSRDHESVKYYLAARARYRDCRGKMMRWWQDAWAVKIS